MPWPRQRELLRSMVSTAHVARRIRHVPGAPAPIEVALVTVESAAELPGVVARLAATTHDRPIEVGTRRQARVTDARHLRWFAGSAPDAPGVAASHLALREVGHPWTIDMPGPLVRSALQLGLADRRIGSTATTAPIFVHCTRTADSLDAILRERIIRCGSDVPDGTPRFDPRGDRWSGRDRYVMLNLGYGRLVDKSYMLAAFIFNEALAVDDILVHRRPEMWETAKRVLDHMLARHPDFVAAVTERPPPQLPGELVRYLATCTAAGRIVLDDTGSAVIARCQQDIVEALYENGPGAADLDRHLARWRTGNRTPGGLRCLTELRRNWVRGGAYRLPNQSPLPPARQDGTQLLVETSLSLDDPAFVALAVSHQRAAEAIDRLRRLPARTVDHFRDLPVIAPAGVSTLAEVARRRD
jgi:hypothetical protein